MPPTEWVLESIVGKSAQCLHVYFLDYLLLNLALFRLDL